MKYIKQIAIDIMWLMLPFFPLYTLLIQLIYKPMSYAKFIFINSFMLTIIIPLGYLTKSYFVPHVLLLNLSGRLGIDVLYLFLVFFVISFLLSIYLYQFFVSKESKLK
jgi:hypothetical protein